MRLDLDEIRKRRNIAVDLVVKLSIDPKRGREANGPNGDASGLSGHLSLGGWREEQSTQHERECGL